MSSSKKLGAGTDSLVHLQYENPLMDRDGGDAALTFIDALLARGEASQAARDIEEMRCGAADRVAVLNEKARRAANRAALINRVAVGEFAPDLMHAVNVYELIANRRFDLVNFDMSTLFPGAEGDDEMQDYIARFRVPVGEPQVAPRLSFPMSLAVRGKPSELEDFQCGSWASMEFLRRDTLAYPDERTYHLTQWGEDFARSRSLDFNALVRLPVLEDPDDFTFESRGVLEGMDAQFATRLLEFYREKALELRLEGAHFEAPIIRRMLVVLPGSRRAEYALEFLPELQFAKAFGAPTSGQDFSGPLDAYDPYALVQGNRNNCANYLLQSRGTSFSGRDRRIKLKSPDGNEQSLRVDSFLNMNLAERVAATEAGTQDGMFMGNRLGVVLFPGRTTKKPEERRSRGFDLSALNEVGFDGVLRGGGSYSLGRSSLGASSVMVGEASVSGGSEGWFRAAKDAGLDRRFAYVPGGQPVIIMARYVTVVR